MGRHRHESDVSAPHQEGWSRDKKIVKDLPMQSSIQHRQRTCNDHTTHTHKYCGTEEQRRTRPNNKRNFKRSSIIVVSSYGMNFGLKLHPPSYVYCHMIYSMISNDLSYVHETSLDENKVCSIFMLFHFLSAPRFRIYILNAWDSI